MAEQQRELQRQLDGVLNRADRQLSILLQTKFLLKDSDWRGLERILKRQSTTLKWPKHVIPDSLTDDPDLSDQEYEALDEVTVDGLTAHPQCLLIGHAML